MPCDSQLPQQTIQMSSNYVYFGADFIIYTCDGVFAGFDIEILTAAIFNNKPECSKVNDIRV